MIRINLLQSERTASRRRAPFQLGSLVQKSPLLGSVVLLGAFLYVGYAWWDLSQRSEHMTAQLAQARQEEARLQSILKQVEQFETQKQQLQERVTLIEELRRGQSAPVHLLDEVSRSLPDRLWLTALTQTGDTVQIEGKTSTLTALADFVGNLENTSYFARPVEIISSEEEKSSRSDAIVLVKFVMKAQFTPPGAAPKPTPAAGPQTRPTQMAQR